MIRVVKLNNKGKGTLSGGVEEELSWFESTEATAVLKEEVLLPRAFKLELEETKPRSDF